jgi:hypothetical protein
MEILPISLKVRIAIFGSRKVSNQVGLSEDMGRYYK